MSRTTWLTSWIMWSFLNQGVCYGQPRSVIITAVRAMNRPFVQLPPVHYLSGDSVLRLTYKQNNISIHFRSPGLHPHYVYAVGKLIDKPIATRDTFLILPSLPNGEFSIQISDQQNPTIKPARLRIIVESPLWLRWWFLPMMFAYGMLFVSACLYLLYRYRIRQFLRLQRVRDRIARDLHDDMGSYLSSISILSQNAHRSATKDPAKTQATLDRIGQTARQVMDSMGDIVWSINPDHDSKAQVIARMTDVASRLFTDDTEPGGRVALEMDVTNEVRQLNLSAECRRDFFLIYKEAITNVARYAQASRVRVKLQRTGGWLEMTVQDNGRGFDVQNPARLNPAGGNGLRNMHTRAALLNGELHIESVIGQGTTMRLRFPV